MIEFRKMYNKFNMKKDINKKPNHAPEFELKTKPLFVTVNIAGEAPAFN